MADSVKKAKAIRVSKLGAFTRKKNHLTQLLDGGADSTKLKEVYADLSKAYADLEKAQEDLLVELPEESIDAELEYLNAPAVALSDMDLRVSTSTQTQKQNEIQKQAEAEENSKKQEFTAAQACFKAKLEGFGKHYVNLSQLSSE